MTASSFQLPDSPILVALDLGGRSDECLRYAWDVARQSQQSLLILHVAHETVATAGMYRRWWGRKDTMPILNIASKMLADFVDDFAAANPGFDGIESTRLVVPGVPGPRIAEIAERCRAEVIVCAAEEVTGGVLGWLRRSSLPVTGRRAPCSVLELPAAG